MRYLRVLLVTEQGADLRPALAAIRGLAPRAEQLTVLVVPPAAAFAWLPTVRAGPAPAPGPWLEALREAAAGAATRARVEEVPEVGAEDLAARLVGESLDLVVAGPIPAAALDALAELRKRQPVAVLWTAGAAAPAEARPFTTVACLALGSLAEASVAAFLRDHGSPGLSVRLFTLARRSPEELATALEVAGIRAAVELVGGGAPWTSFEALVRPHAVDLVVLPRFPLALLRRASWPAPVLVLPLPPATAWAMQRPLDVPDLVDDGGPVRVRLAYALGVGRRPPISDQEVAFVSGGRVAARVTTRGGMAELPAGLGAEAFGVFRVGRQPAADPLAAIERQVTVLRPGNAALVLFDVDAPEEALPALRDFAEGSGGELLAVRLRPERSCHLLRDRLREAGLRPRVVDASAVLDEGDAEDIDAPFDALRLARVGARLRRTGFPVAAMVFTWPDSAAPEPLGFELLRVAELAGRRLALPAPVPPPRTLAERLDLVTGSRARAGNRVALELDNAGARGALLQVIGGAARRLHLQVYLVKDDAVARQVEAALVEAGRRGVAVRVLADSLHGLHGSFGARNPLLQRLSEAPGVEVKVIRPVTGVPSLEELKQRDHRKLVVVDGALALLGGRNLAYEYYTGFDEVPLTAESSGEEVPWLDGGARLEGPAVADLERSFLEAWTGAGGAPFEVEVPAPAGSCPVRVVVHRGLRDAATLEAYLAVIESARSHLYAVNGFPLLLELQHALVKAVERGVRVRTLFGHVTPFHGGEPFEGSWSSARTVATWLVHSRMDALVAVGAEGYQLAVPGASCWAEDLGPVMPHVHAKVLSADGRVCTIGSPNLDVTASYWESELLVVLEDEGLARALEARVDLLLAGSVRVKREDLAWQRLAKQREFLRHWPSVLSA